jgi:iron complex transport system ATP-binding protein
MIRFQHASARLAGRPVLHDITLTLGKGELVALVGPNGAGKSTLLKVAAGLLAPSGGLVALDGREMGEWPAAERAGRVSWLPQVRPVAWNLRGEDVVALGRYASGAGVYARLDEAGKRAVDRAMERMSADHLRGRGVNELSGGEVARLHVARILASEAHILLLDEPAAALDIEHQIGLMDVLTGEATSGRTVLVAVHDLDLAARYCARMLVLQQGRIVRDAAPAVALDENVLADVFHVRRGANGALERI